MNLSSSKSTIISPGRHLRGTTARSVDRRGILVSPLFGSGVRGRRKRPSGSGLENNPEPSSPKVSCIGQVRVKTRKHMQKKMRGARSMRKSKGGGGGRSGRRSAGTYQNEGFDRLVHLPVSICESIRSLGSELNCFSSCGSRPSGDGGGCGRRSSCGGPFTRWFVAVEETPGGKRREIELVVGGEDEEEHGEMWRRNQRRQHVFDDIDLDEIEAKAEKEKSKDEDEGEAQFVPPKNALLLMRCRSNPVKAAALGNRVRQRSASLKNEARDEEEGGDIEEDEQEEQRRRLRLELEDKKRIELCQRWISGDFIAEITESDPVSVSQNNEAAGEEERVRESMIEAEIHHEDPKDEEIEEQLTRKSEDNLRNLPEEDAIEIGNCTETIAESGERVKGKEEDTAVIETLFQERIEHESSTMKKEDQTQNRLLIMTCEPEMAAAAAAATVAAEETDVGCGEADNRKKQSNLTTTNKASSDKPPFAGRTTKPAAAFERPRMSWSYVAAPPTLASAVAAEDKRNGGCSSGREPLVLTRCKSEPRKSAAAKLVAPEGCFWKNMKMVEPHPPASVGVGAAGVGF